MPSIIASPCTRQIRNLAANARSHSSNTSGERSCCATTHTVGHFPLLFPSSRLPSTLTLLRTRSCARMPQISAHVRKSGWTSASLYTQSHASMTSGPASRPSTEVAKDSAAASSQSRANTSMGDGSCAWPAAPFGAFPFVRPRDAGCWVCGGGRFVARFRRNPRSTGGWSVHTMRPTRRDKARASASTPPIPVPSSTTAESASRMG